jgi:uncharacterized membrane protein
MTTNRGNISMETRVPHRKAQYAAMMLGIGLGGFVDGIVLHQIVQWHNSHSAPRKLCIKRIFSDSLLAVKRP